MLRASFGTVFQNKTVKGNMDLCEIEKIDGLKVFQELDMLNIINIDLLTQNLVIDWLTLARV